MGRITLVYDGGMEAIPHRAGFIGRAYIVIDKSRQNDIAWMPAQWP